MHPGAPSVCRICACALALSVACSASGTPDGAVADDGGGEAAPIVVEAAWLAARLGDGRTVPLFIHGDSAFAAAHLPGSAHIDVERMVTTRAGIPREAIDAAPFADLMAEAGIPRAGTVVVYEEAVTFDGPRAFWTLEYFDHPDVRFLDGGLDAWQAAGLPTESGPPTRGPVVYPVPAPRADRFADAAHVLARLGDGATQIVDARPAADFAAGHIPGAVSLSFADLLDGPRLSPAARLAGLVSARGILPTAPVITYCQTGYRGAGDYLVFRHLGYPDVRLYDGSWVEWGGRADLPKEK